MLAANQAALAARLAAPGGDKRLAHDETHSPFAMPVTVICGATSSFAIEVTRLVDAFSHTVLVGLVGDVHLPDDPRDPLAYLDGQFVRAAGL